jgi:hypothetical protein
MNFDNVSLLGYRHENKFFGESSFQIGTVRILDIKGYILDLANSKGVNNIMYDAIMMAESLKDFQDVIINGRYFGMGKVTSFSVDPGNWVRSTEYSATIEVIENKDVILSNNKLTSKEFTGVDLRGKNLPLIKDFSEQFSLDFTPENTVMQGKHSIDVQFSAGIEKTEDLIQYAKILAEELLRTLPESLVEGNYSYRRDFVRLNTESYDVFSKRCGFETTFSYRKPDDDEDETSYERTYTIIMDVSQSFIQVVESGNFKLASDSTFKKSKVSEILKKASSGAHARCQNYFNKYKATVCSTNRSPETTGVFSALNDFIIDATFKADEIKGEGSYTLTFNNNPKNGNKNYTIEKSLSLSRNSDGTWSAEENGRIEGWGIPGGKVKYNNAVDAWILNRDPAAIKSRIISFFNANAKKDPKTPPLKLDSRSISFATFKGVLSYNYTMTTDARIEENSGVKSLDGVHQVSISDPGRILSIKKEFIIPNNKMGMRQATGAKQQSAQSIQVKINNPDFKSSSSSSDPCKCSQNVVGQIFPGEKFFENLNQDYIFDIKYADPTAKDIYLESLSFSSDGESKSVTMNKTYKYS